MDVIRGWWKAARALVRKGAVEREMRDELAFHLEMETEKNARSGMDPDAARRAALVSFGGVERFKEEVRSARRAGRVEAVAADVRSAVRTFRRAPGLAAVALLTLALGIGAAAAMFGVVDAAVLQPLPWPEPERLVLVRETTPEGSPFTTSEPNYLDFRASRSFVELAAFRQADLTLTGEGEPLRIRGLAATHTLFPLLGAEPALGRAYGAEQDRPGSDTRFVVLSHGLWQRAFGGDPSLAGRRILLDGEAHLVTGVMPEDFDLFGAELWVPLAPDSRAERDDHWLDVIGRLAPGVTIGEAEADLERIASAIAAEHPEVAGWGVELRTMHEWIVGPEFRRAGWMLLAAVGLLLLMACANVANLLLAHATTRQSDLAVRAALGAGRARLARQLACESLLLSLAAAALGLLGASWAIDLVRALGAGMIPRAGDIGLDGRAFGFAAAAALVTALLFGFLPALQAARTDAGAQLRHGGRTGASRGQRRLRDALVVAQVAVAVVLLLGAGLMLRSFARLQSVDPGFRTENVWAVPLQMPAGRYPDEQATFSFYRDVLERVAAVPGVEAAAATVVNPFGGFNLMNDVTPADRAAETSPGGFAQAAWRIVSPGYFETLDIPLLSGRVFGPDDRYGNPPTVMITRTLAERLWPGRDAVGRRLFWGGTDGEPRTVIGVVGDVRDVGLENDPPPLMFLSYRQLVMPMMTVVVRTGGEVQGLERSIRAAIRSLDPDLPVPQIRPLADSRAAAVAGPRLRMTLLAVFAAVALVLATIGLYGLLAFVVARQTREIGVRRALGARSVTVSRMVVRRGLTLAGLGIALGLVAAVGLTRFVESLLYRTAGIDPVTFLAVPALFAAVALIAASVPARRAARVDPMIALRSE